MTTYVQIYSININFILNTRVLKSRTVLLVLIMVSNLRHPYKPEYNFLNLISIVQFIIKQNKLSMIAFSCVIFDFKWWLIPKCLVQLENLPTLRDLYRKVFSKY